MTSTFSGKSCTKDSSSTCRATGTGGAHGRITATPTTLLYDRVANNGGKVTHMDHHPAPAQLFSRHAVEGRRKKPLKKKHNSKNKRAWSCNDPVWFIYGSSMLIKKKKKRGRDKKPRTKPKDPKRTGGYIWVAWAIRVEEGGKENSVMKKCTGT